MSRLINTRGVAAAIVNNWLSKGMFPDRMLDSVHDDRAFVAELVYGVAKQRRGLEWVLDRYCERRPSRKLLSVLMVGMYQLLYMDGTARYAAVNETMNAASGSVSEVEKKFVNAVLRRVAGERESLLRGLMAEEPGIAQSHPDILLSRWVDAFGADGTRALCEWNNGRPQLTLRIREHDVGTYVARLAEVGIKGEPHPFRPSDFIVLGGGVNVVELPGYAEGLFTVQDPSTAIAVDLMGDLRGCSVLDACAAPGGKTLLLADRMKGHGRVVAMDADAGRLARLESNVQRVGHSAMVELRCGDARASGYVDKFDAILLDVPCSNTGVLRRRADARWRFTKERQADLLILQRALLDSASVALKPGGMLVYSTCSLEHDEGGARFHGWLADNAGFRFIDERRTFPPVDSVDGIYAGSAMRLSG